MDNIMAVLYLLSPSAALEEFKVQDSENAVPFPETFSPRIKHRKTTRPLTLSRIANSADSLVSDDLHAPPPSSLFLSDQCALAPQSPSFGRNLDRRSGASADISTDDDDFYYDSANTSCSSLLKAIPGYFPSEQRSRTPTSIIDMERTTALPTTNFHFIRGSQIKVMKPTAYPLVESPEPLVRVVETRISDEDVSALLLTPDDECMELKHLVITELKLIQDRQRTERQGLRVASPCSLSRPKGKCHTLPYHHSQNVGDSDAAADAWSELYKAQTTAEEIRARHKVGMKLLPIPANEHKWASSKRWYKELSRERTNLMKRYTIV